MSYAARQDIVVQLTFTKTQAKTQALGRWCEGDRDMAWRARSPCGVGVDNTTEQLADEGPLMGKQTKPSQVGVYNLR